MSQRQEALQRAQERLNELAFQMRYRLDRSMFDRYRDVQLASSLDALWSVSFDSRRQVLKRFRDSYTDYAWIGFNNTDGRVLVSTNRIQEGEDISQQPWFCRRSKGPVHRRGARIANGRAASPNPG